MSRRTVLFALTVVVVSAGPAGGAEKWADPRLKTSGGLGLWLVAVPRSNPGNFRALFALNDTGKNDYQTGLTVDLTGEASATFDRVNVEGIGFGGAVNLLSKGQPFGATRVLEVRCGKGDDGVR